MIIFLAICRVPRHAPRTNLLDDPEKSQQSRSSWQSINSATGLLRVDSSSSFGDTAPSVTPLTRTGSGPRTYRVTNGMPATPATARSPATDIPSNNYGATWSSDRPAVPRVAYTQNSFSQTRRQSSGHQLPPRPLTLYNPFDDRLPRHGSPDSMISALTFSAESAVSHSNWTGGMTLSSNHQPTAPPLVGLNVSSPVTSRESSRRSLSQGSYAATSSDTPQYLHSLYTSQPPSYTASDLLNPRNVPPYDTPTLTWLSGTSLRTHTATPHSAHSVAPSMHLTHDLSHTAPPAAAHMRDGSAEPVWRPYSADPHLHNDPPNHFPMAGGSADVRRLATLPSGQYHPGRSGHGGTYVASRNASHLAGALGATPPRSESAVKNKEEWRQLVLKAASGRSSR